MVPLSGWRTGVVELAALKRRLSAEYSSESADPPVGLDTKQFEGPGDGPAPLVRAEGLVQLTARCTGPESFQVSPRSREQLRPARFASINARQELEARRCPARLSPLPRPLTANPSKSSSSATPRSSTGGPS